MRSQTALIGLAVAVLLLYGPSAWAQACSSTSNLDPYGFGGRQYSHHHYGSAPCEYDLTYRRPRPELPYAGLYGYSPYGFGAYPAYPRSYGYRIHGYRSHGARSHGFGLGGFGHRGGSGHHGGGHGGGGH